MIDSRSSREGATIRRRRECIQCAHRFTTYEEIERQELMVVKRDGRREGFSREKLHSGLKKAFQKRPVGPEVVEDLLAHDSLLASLVRQGGSRLSSFRYLP